MTGERPPTVAEETAVRTLLALAAAHIKPGPEALSRIRDEITRKTAAPARTGTAATPNGWKGPKDMHTLQIERTPRGQQMAAALALFHLLEADTPDAEWHVTDTGGLCGHVTRVLDSDARRDMRRYAGFLGAALDASPSANACVEWVRLSTSATYRGVAVKVWTHVDVQPVTEVRS